MIDHDKLNEQGFRLMMASTNYQALFGALALALIGAAAIAWDARTSLTLAIASAFLVILSHVVSAHAMVRMVYQDKQPTPLSLIAAKVLWYLSVALGALAFAALN